MTDAEWNVATNPTQMLEALRKAGVASDRKLRLFSVACCWHLLGQVQVNPWDNEAVQVAERYADGNATPSELAEAAAATTSDYSAAFACAEAASPEGGIAAADAAADNAAQAVGDHIASLAETDDIDDSLDLVRGRDAERVVQVSILRDIFGSPFRTRPAIDPAWLAWNNNAVQRLAEAAYDDRVMPQGTLDPKRLRAVADALEKAGCQDEVVLEHLRAPGPHVRGCWVIDLLLSKA